MVVLHCITRFNQGGTVTWLNNLIANDKETYLVSGECSEDEQEGIPNQNFQFIKISHLKRSINPINDVIALVELIRIFRKIKPELLVTHTFKAGALGRIAIRFACPRSAKVIHTYHGHLQYGYFSSFGSRAVNWIERALQSITDGFIVNGYKVAMELQSVGLLRKPYEVILPGVDLLPNEKNQKLKGNRMEVTVGWLGRLTSIKRPEMVVSQALRFPSVRFIVGGHGELESHLRSIAPINLEFLGWTSPENFWPIVDVGLLTSQNEAAPFSLIEAAFYGVPCVATDVGSVSDVVIDGVTGFLVEANDESITEKLEKLINDEGLRISMSRNARDLAAKEFTLKRFREKHKDFFLQITTN